MNSNLEKLINDEFNHVPDVKKKVYTSVNYDEFKKYCGGFDFYGCGDTSCLIFKPSSMSTNGGCRCFRDYIKMQKFIKLVKGFLGEYKL